MIEFVIGSIASVLISEFSKKPKLAKGGSVLLAPNGKPSNLTPEQYKLVRTKAFKDWFGDWENNPSEASKVVDENGEPLVVYHGTDADFNFFDISVPIKHGRGEGEGFYFTRDKKIAKHYGKKIKPYFLNAKRQWRGFDSLNSEEKKIYLSTKNDKDAYEKLKVDFIFISENHLIVFKPTQIKLADGTNTTFDGNNPDIRFKKGGLFDRDTMAGGHQYTVFFDLNGRRTSRKVFANTKSSAESWIKFQYPEARNISSRKEY